jgi:hypothetical protein
MAGCPPLVPLTSRWLQTCLLSICIFVIQFFSEKGDIWEPRSYSRSSQGFPRSPTKAEGTRKEPANKIKWGEKHRRTAWAVQKGRRWPPALRAGPPWKGHKAVLGVVHPQGIEPLGMAGPSDTLGSPWPLFAIHPLGRLCKQKEFYSTCIIENIVQMTNLEMYLDAHTMNPTHFCPI